MDTTLLVRDVMTIGVPICRESEACGAVAVRLGGTPVVVVLNAAGAACGWTTRSALERQTAVATIGEMMEEAIPTIPPDIPAAAALQLMRDQGLDFMFLMHMYPGEPRPSAYLAREALERRLLEDQHAGCR